MRRQFALGRSADRLFARVTEVGIVFLDANQEATRARRDGRAMLPDIRAAGLDYCGYSHKRRLARLSQILEMCLNALDERIYSQWGRGAKM